VVKRLTDSDAVIIEGLQQAQSALRVLFYAALPEHSLGRLVQMVTLQASIHMSRIAPYLTGTLRAAHRERMLEAALGEVFIDPTVINPILGGRPVEYGAMVHQVPGKDWMRRTADEDSRAIVNEATEYWLQREVSWRMP